MALFTVEARNGNSERPDFAYKSLEVPLQGSLFPVRGRAKEPDAADDPGEAR
ncbi:hypothetical protein [Saccharopolyspora thermophila]|uniref:hypothetical protein n=1 Tax=Saccharopolyspora thermophila TaxID=89367 RepID=UPI0016674A98|nr:hypothetical protein [Saccharopolyspora subtropica]